MAKLIQMRNNDFTKGLNQLIAFLKESYLIETMAEIGSYQGESTVLFGQALPSSIIYAIDPWNAEPSQSIEHISQSTLPEPIKNKLKKWLQDNPTKRSNEIEMLVYGKVLSANEEDYDIVERYFDKRTKPYQNIVKIKNTSLGAVSRFQNNSLDFVYIDANHSYESVKEDIALWTPKLKHGRFIAGHDYSIQNGWGQVVKAVDEMLGKPDVIFYDTSWIKLLP